MAANKEQLLEERLRALSPDQAKTVTATTAHASASSRHSRQFISRFRLACKFFFRPLNHIHHKSAISVVLYLSFFFCCFMYLCHPVI